MNLDIDIENKKQKIANFIRFIYYFLLQKKNNNYKIKMLKTNPC